MTSSTLPGPPPVSRVAAGRAPVLELRDVRASYGSIEVLHGVDLCIGAGSVVALLGPNGVGKSTTLKIASGLLSPTSGCIHIAGRHVNGASADAIARAGVRTVPEGRGIFPNLTVAENLRLLTRRGRTRMAVEDRAYTRFPRLGERRRQLAGTMSGGEQQMLAIARALVTEPAVLLVDELSMGLSPLLVQDLYGHLSRIAEEGVSILVVEQFAHAVMGVADHAVLMLQGRVQRSGHPAELAGDLAAAYLGART